jgi:hypothetical protein
MRFCGFALALWVAVAGVGCSLDFDPGEPAVDDETLAEDVVMVSFWNRTVTEAVDVQFHAANELLDTLPDDLFVDANRVTRSIGLAGRGILEPGMLDSISFPCTDDLTLGTMGGEFSDAETGDERGVGAPRWAQAEPLGLCGSVVTIEFYREGDEYMTRLSLSH